MVWTILQALAALIVDKAIAYLHLLSGYLFIFKTQFEIIITKKKTHTHKTKNCINKKKVYNFFKFSWEIREEKKNKNR